MKKIIILIIIPLALESCRKTAIQPAYDAGVINYPSIVMWEAAYHTEGLKD